MTREPSEPTPALGDFFEHAATPLHCVGPDGTILRANQAELDLLGYTHEEYVGHPIREFHADRRRLDDLLGRLLAGEVVRSYPARLKCKDGSIRDVLIDSSVYRQDARFMHTLCFTRDVSAQRRAEAALRRAQERFELAARAAQALIRDWDVVRGTVAWAGPVLAFFASRPEEDSGNYHSAWANRVHPDDLRLAEAMAQAAFDSQAESWEHEYRFCRADGSYAHVVERAFITRDAQGRVVRVVGAMQDISQQKAAHDATVRLAAIVTSATDAIVGKTLDGIVTSWNAAAERIFGYTAQEMVGQSIFTLIPEELHEEERALLESLRRGERVEFPDTVRIRKGGSRIAVAVTVSPIWDAAGRVIGASSIKRDITERKRAAEEIARREERYRSLVVATTSVVWTAAPNGSFGEPQPSWEHYTGQSWEEHQEFGWLNAIHPDDRVSVEASWRQARECQSLYEARGRVWCHAQQTYRHFVGRAAPVADAEGRIREWIGTLTDVEDRWRAEERLRQAERMESVGRLAGGIAHEANNQMTVILGAAEFLLRQLQDEHLRRDVVHMRDAARRTATITQQLLAFSRRQVLQTHMVDVNAVVTRLQPILQRALGETSQVLCRLAPDLGRVKADQSQLDQILLNLVLNARDAMPDGGVLTIETANVTLDETYSISKAVTTIVPGPYIQLTVSDTGVGIDRALLGRVFEPFFTTKETGKGTGLGLSTVYGIVKQSGGFIWVYSEPAHGTVFKIYLPIVADSAALPVDGAPGSTPGGNEVILLAEDNVPVREVLARTLREQGYTVLEAVDGAEALELVTQRAAPPDLVITDMIMPRMGGKDLGRWLIQRWPKLPVLFMSGYVGIETETGDVREESWDFMQKPLESEALVRCVRRMLNARQADTRVM